MHRVERSIRVIHRRAGLHGETIGRVLASDLPQVYRRRGLEARPRKGWIEDQPRADPRVPSMRRASWAASYGGGKAIFDDFVRGLRPRFLARRTFQGMVSRNASTSPSRAPRPWRSSSARRG